VLYGSVKEAWGGRRALSPVTAPTWLPRSRPRADLAPSRSSTWAGSSLLRRRLGSRAGRAGRQTGGGAGRLFRRPLSEFAYTRTLLFLFALGGALSLLVNLRARYAVPAWTWAAAGPPLCARCSSRPPMISRRLRGRSQMLKCRFLRRQLILFGCGRPPQSTIFSNSGEPHPRFHRVGVVLLRRKNVSPPSCAPSGRVLLDVCSTSRRARNRLCEIGVKLP